MVAGKTIDIARVQALIEPADLIIAHNAGRIHEFLHAHHWDSGLAGQVANLIIGVITGALVCAVVLPLMKLLRKKTAH